MGAFQRDINLFVRIAYIECHDLQGAANLKYWFDNKWVHIYILDMSCDLSIRPATSKAVGRQQH
jgi:hypothetical protein